jgi:hypothetical protein
MVFGPPVPAELLSSYLLNCSNVYSLVAYYSSPNLPNEITLALN